MKQSRLKEEIRDANLAYLLLAQQLIQEDRAEAMIRLGISEPTAEIIVQLTTAQIIKISSSNTLICSLRSNDDMVWQLMADHGGEVNNTSGLHAAILEADCADELLRS